MKPTRKASAVAVDQSAESELTIQADGRIFAFGITSDLAAVLAAIPTADGRTRRSTQRLMSARAARDRES